MKERWEDEGSGKGKMSRRKENIKMLERVKEGRWERGKEESSTVQIGGKL